MHRKENLEELFKELLGRSCPAPGFAAYRSFFEGKNVLITGAAGSIGSALARTISRFCPRLLLLTDQSETGLFALSQELKEDVDPDFVQYIMASMHDESRFSGIICQSRPDIVFHAAAYKHVPLMEAHPYEALRTNTYATLCLARLCAEHQVSKFIFISTDKAVYPSGIMGASKRLAEKCLMQMHPQRGTQFIVARFGNVLGSSGSCVPTFLHRIGQQKPIEITHPDVCRYFMSMDEACLVLLEAAQTGSDGDLFTFDMGQPIHIATLAEKLIGLSGLRPGIDIPVRFTGLRPGEKLKERLFYQEEVFNKCTAGISMCSRTFDHEINTNQLIAAMHDLLASADDELALRFLQEAVPEYEPVGKSLFAF